MTFNEGMSNKVCLWYVVDSPKYHKHALELPHRDPRGGGQIEGVAAAVNHARCTADCVSTSVTERSFRRRSSTTEIVIICPRILIAMSSLRLMILVRLEIYK